MEGRNPSAKGELLLNKNAEEHFGLGKIGVGLLRSFAQ